jgi:hypothetical protein
MSSIPAPHALLARAGDATRSWRGRSAIPTPSVLSLRPPIQFATPVPQSVTRTSFTHHQKTIIVDAPPPSSVPRNAHPEVSTRRHVVSFVGGLDLCDGRWELGEKGLRAAARAGHEHGVRGYACPALGVLTAFCCTCTHKRALTRARFLFFPLVSHTHGLHARDPMRSHLGTTRGTTPSLGLTARAAPTRETCTSRVLRVRMRGVASGRWVRVLPGSWLSLMPS